MLILKDRLRRALNKIITKKNKAILLKNKTVINLIIQTVF